MTAECTRASVSTTRQKYDSLIAEGQFPLILLPRSNLGDEINTAMLTKLAMLTNTQSLPTK